MKILSKTALKKNIQEFALRIFDEKIKSQEKFPGDFYTETRKKIAQFCAKIRRVLKTFIWR